MPSLTQRAHARQVLAVALADRNANRAQACVRRVWAQMLRDLRLPAHDAAQRVLRSLRALPDLARQNVADSLGGVLRLGTRSARAGVVASVPKRLLVRAAQRRVYGPARRDEQVPARRVSGVRQGSLAESFNWLDLLAPFLRPPDDPDDTALDWRAILFPAPSADHAERVIFGSGWLDRIREGTGLGSPEAIAQRVFVGLTLGQTHQEIARELLPVVDGVRSSAKRLARTESMRVAAATQMEAHAALGDLVIGYTIHATLDANTRPWHRARDKQQYFIDPTPDQKGPMQMPHPPDEAADPAERPPGAPRTAWNCRCFLVPILRD
jgi:hypothetical protein